jgi:hypothetical protein
VRATEEHFSPEALWRTCFRRGETTHDGTTVEAIGSAISSPGQPLLAAWPYNSTLAHGTEEVPSAAQNVAWETATLISIPLSPGGQIHIEDALAASRPVLIAIELSDEFSYVSGDAVVPVPASIPEPQGYHAILIVGASWDESAGRTYRVLNSWGGDWGDGGYTWLPALYIDRHTVAAAVVV